MSPEISPPVPVLLVRYPEFVNSIGLEVSQPATSRVTFNAEMLTLLALPKAVAEPKRRVLPDAALNETTPLNELSPLKMRVPTPALEKPKALPPEEIFPDSVKLPVAALNVLFAPSKIFPLNELVLPTE